MGVWAGGGPLGGVKMRDKDCGGDILDEDGDDGETVWVAAVAAAVVVGGAKLAAELRDPTRRDGSEGRPISTIGLRLGVDVRGPS